MDPFSQPGSFQNLLNSQHPNISFSFVTREPSLELSSSDTSVFGTQWADDGKEDEVVVSDRKERRKWTPTEDIVLIGAWLNTSKDPVMGNEQKTIAFWKRIASYVASSPKLSALQKRDPSHCKQRWGKIIEGVCKFVGCYEAATKAKSSGMNGDDVLKMAHEIFFTDYKAKFTLEHAWLELRHDKKWCGVTKEKVSSKRRKLDDGSAQSSTSVPGCDGEGEAMARPAGVKASKAKAKTKATTSEEAMEFQSLWEIKQKDFEFKDKLNKKKLLDGLIAKTEPLSDLEIALKNKSISEMLLSYNGKFVWFLFSA
ncbi:glutathione S-transferase T3-like [Brassica napus]|uniref:glutathione S-transferase T3-like n=1 Tax=Brassica oleracea var. oleracea TaxID=109376 RepID=UPI0006A73FD1|nr:PREDICTED: glutathione S-transferase T3-like [Brassica oleracea var. oleracea]XP_048616619.1 glutathione S-transferase T3-like [Brassica napus]